MFCYDIQCPKITAAKNGFTITNPGSQLLKGLNLPYKLNNYPFCLIFKLRTRKLIPKL